MQRRRKTRVTVGAPEVLRPTTARLSSAYGWRTIAGRRDYHTGNDYAAPYGSPVYASAAGTVIASELINRYGLAVVVRHDAVPRPLFTLYGHLAQSLVTKGQIVDEGEEIAKSGDSAGTREDPDARTSAPHLHHELLTKWPPAGVDLDRIDPQPYMRGAVSAPAARVTRTAGSAGFLAILLALGYYYTRSKKKRRFVADRRPAQDPPTVPGDRWLE